MSRFPRRLNDLFRKPVASTAGARRRDRRLGLEALEDRRLLAATDLAAITGRVFLDLNESGDFDSGEQIPDASVQLFRDATGDGLDGSDPQQTGLGSPATTDANGVYRFDGLTAGTYFVVQPEQTVDGRMLERIEMGPITFDTADVMGQAGTLIDQFITTQTVTDSTDDGNADVEFQDLAAGEAAGNERDVAVDLNVSSGTDQAQARVASGMLNLDQSVGAESTFTVVWDGNDNSTNVDTSGLNLDLTEGGTRTRLAFNLMALLPDDNAVITIQNATQTATTTVPLLPGSNDYDIPFDDFSGNTNVFSSVGAITFSIASNEAGNDLRLMSFGPIGPTVETEDFSNDPGIDLELEKGVDDETPDVGENVTFTVTVNNNGPDTATNIDVRDVVPDGFTYVAGSISGGDSRDASNPTGSGLLWEIDNLASGANEVLSFQATVLSGGSVADYTNSAQVTAADQVDSDSIPGNNVPGEDDQDNEVVTPTAIDLELQKSVDDDAPDVNQGVTFTITVQNQGPDAATDIDVRDIVPDGFSYVAGSISGGDSRDASSPTGSGLLWEINRLDAGANRDLTFQATVLSGASASDYTNTAQVTAADEFDTDSTPNNNVASEDDQDDAVVMPTEVDLELSKTVNDTTPDIGEEVTFTITVMNQGPDTANNIDVRDVVPDGFTYVPGSIAGSNRRDASSPTGSGLLWEIDSLTAGGSRDLTFRAEVLSGGSTADYTNSAQITAVDEIDADSTPGNNAPGEDDQDSVVVEPTEIDVELEKVVDDTTPDVGENVTFTITVRNDGPDAATDIDVRDIVPDGFTYVTNSINGGDSNNDNSPTGSGLLWEIDRLEAGNSRNLTFRATVLSGGSVADYTNSAQVTATDEFDSDSTPNNDVAGEDDQDSAVVSPTEIDLELEKTVDELTPDVGETVTFTITVRNEGPDAASGIDVRDIVPDGVTYVADSISGGDSNDDDSPTASGLLWEIDNLAAGASRTLTFDVTVLSSGSVQDYTNTAQVTAADEFDTDSTPNNNVADEDDQDNAIVSPTAIDLELEKLVDDTTPDINQVVEFTITVRNVGPDAATDVEVRDVVPDGFDYVDGSISGGDDRDDDSPTSSGLQWVINRLEADASRTLTFRARVLTVGSVEDYTNSAQVTAADEFDTDSTPNNDVASEDDQDAAAVMPVSIDLELEKSVNELTPTVNDVVTFTITVQNDGMSTATNVEVKDVVPDGFAYVEGSISGGDNRDDDNPTGSGLEWDIDSIAPGGSEQLSFDATVQLEGSESDYTNIAQVTEADQVDIDSSPDNDVADEDDQDDAVVMPQVIDLELDKRANDNSPNVDDVVTFTITVRNDGPDTATNIDVRDVVPDGFSYVAGSIAGGDSRSATSPTGSGLLWEIDSLADGEDSVLTFDARVLPGGSTADYTNSAEVAAAAQFDPDSTPNNDIASEDDQDDTVIAPQEIDLELDKSVSDDTPVVNEVVTFTITVTNQGPDTATNIDVRDVVPFGFSYVVDSIEGGDDRDDSTPTSSGLLWEIDSLSAGASRDLAFRALVLSDRSAAEYTNSAELTAADQFDPDSTPDNNVASEDDQDSVVVEPLELASISGFVYFDRDNDGNFDGNEGGIPNVIIRLSGEVDRMTTTNSAGFYQFDDLPPGDYTVQESQPLPFEDGVETPGDDGLGEVSGEDQFFFKLGLDDEAEDYNFAELRPRTNKRFFVASAR